MPSTYTQTGRRLGWVQSGLGPQLPAEPPPHILGAAVVIERWMESQGVQTWEMNGICSRNHADKLREIKAILGGTE